MIKYYNCVTGMEVKKKQKKPAFVCECNFSLQEKDFN